LILYLAAGYWLVLWLLAPAGAESSIKSSYPRIETIEALRASFLSNLTGLSAESEALVAGLTIGERDLVSDELANQMRDLSLTHLVAVSGANLAIVLGAIYFLGAAIGLSRNYRFAFALLVMGGYVLLVGPESSVIRAATMALFVMLSLWLGRGSNPIYSLASAVLLLLLVDPGLAVDVGFGLSAFATAGLVGLTPLIYQKLEGRWPKFLAAAVAATSAAQVYTLPIILYLQPSLPLYSVVANLLVEAAVAPITILGLISVLLSQPLPLAAMLFSWLASIGAQWIVFTAQHLSELPFVRLHFLPGSWGIAAATLFAFLLTIYFKSERWQSASRLAIYATLLISGSWIATDLIRYKTFAGDWEIYACDVGQGDALLVRSQNSVALIDTGRDSQLVENCVADAGVSEIEMLVLTHFDADHVAGLPGVIERVSGKLLVSPFRDSRLIVDESLQLASEHGVEVSYAHEGMQGNLGEISWLVLSPSPSAYEASDSNDASVTMVFDFGDFVLLALADLGEAGQQRLLKKHPALLQQLAQRELAVKVAHHGSADQSESFYRRLNVDIGLFLVGKNPYGHPTRSALSLIDSGTILRTDKHGPIALSFDGQLLYRVGGKLTT
jgi:competence protein ComEC